MSDVGTIGQEPILLDTHIAIWLANANPRLKPAKINLLKGAFRRNALCLSAISAWEIGLLVSRGRLDLSEHPLIWFTGFVGRFRINVLDLTPEIAISSNFLPGNLHGDPADRILVATSIAHSAAIITADSELQRYGKSGVVRVIAC